MNSAQNLKGIALMVSAMAFLAVGDATIKQLSATYSQTVFLIIAGVGLSLMCFVATLFTGETLFDARALSGPPLLRSLAEILAGSTMMIALAIVPFTVLTFMLQAIPLFVTLGAVLFLGEKVGLKRWGAVLIGFLGVLVILRPGSASFTVEWLFALAAAASLAARDLCSRAVSRDISTLQISAWGAVAVGLAGAVAHLVTGATFPSIPLGDVPYFLLILFAWAGGMISVTEAMRMGEVGVVAPFRYMRLPIGLAIGLFYFGESIDFWMIIGVLIIVASGLFVLSRELRSR